MCAGIGQSKMEANEGQKIKNTIIALVLQTIQTTISMFVYSGFSIHDSTTV